MKQFGITQKELASKMGISQAALAKKLKYDNWRESDIKEICDILGIGYDIRFKIDDDTYL